MRKLLPLLAFLLVDLSACKNDTSKLESRANSETKVNVTRDKQKITDLGKIYNQHLNEGRERVNTRDYPGAIASFDMALAIDPNDARALSEISWAAFLGKELERAEKAGRDSVRFAKDDDIKGASLYNLGRIAEERGQVNEAVRFYRDSLLVRANKTVAARIAKLAASIVTDKAAMVEISSCGFTHIPSAESVSDICARVADNNFISKNNCKGTTNEDGLDWTVTQSLTPGDEFETVLLATMDIDRATQYVYVVVETTEGWFAMHAADVYNPGAFGIWEEITSLNLNLRQLVAGSPTELLLEYKKVRSDSDMGIGELEFESVDRVVAVGLDMKKPIILANLMRKESYQREQISEASEGSEHLQTKGLPINNEAGATVTFDGSGNVNIGAVKNQIPTHPVGTYSLGDAAITKCL